MKKYISWASEASTNSQVSSEIWYIYIILYIYSTLDIFTMIFLGT